MVIRFSGIALVCLVALPAGQAVAQGRDPYPPRIVYVEPYPDEPPPGYYRRAPRRYYRLPPGYDGDGVVVIERRGAYFGLGAAPEPPFVRPYYGSYRAVEGPYDDPPPRPRFRRANPDPIGPDDGRAVSAEERRWRERYAALPREPEGLSPQSAQRSDRADQPSSAAELPARLRRQVVSYRTNEPAGTIIVDTRNTYLYYVLGDGKAMRYGIGVGREGFTWSGRERISRKAEWPDWYPPKDMLERQPYLPRMMAGGPGNPLGARALYLGNTLYRIHGTSDASSIGRYVSSGCIRMLNDDVMDLYERVKVGSKVVVLRGGRRPGNEVTARR